MPHDERRWKASKIKVGTFASVIRTFLTSPKFQNYAPATRDAWARELRLAERVDTLGAISTDVIRPSLIQAFLDGLSDRPAKQTNAKTALKALERWALVRDLLPFPITTGTEVIGSDGGHIPWSDEQVELAETHARPEMARAVTLGANTGQRGSDLVKMRWSDIEVYGGRPGINVKQQKTGKVLWIPFTLPLQAALANWERRPGFILVKANGEGFTRKRLSGDWLRERDTNPALEPLRASQERHGLVIHGLRATAVVRLRRDGATIPQICDMVGMSKETVEIYCRHSEQRENALAAVLHLDRTAREQRKMKDR
jgi:integrase